MAHYAFLDSDNIVVEVIVGKDEGEDGVDWEQWYGDFSGKTCKRTSYNTKGGAHSAGGTAFRKNYAGIGFTYDSQRDAFIPPRPYASWTLNEQTCLWESPVAYPEGEQIHVWNEDAGEWVQA